MSDVITVAPKKETIQAPVSLTESAAKEVKRIMVEKEVPADYGLRLGVQGGGCSGLSYLLGFDVKKENDLEFDIYGVKMLIQKSHGIYLTGIELDYKDDLNNRGFIFNNPNAVSTCGCGSSFSA